MTHTDLTASQERIAELKEALMTEKWMGVVDIIIPQMYILWSAYEEQ